MLDGQPSSELTPPHPPRFWWLKRLMAVGIVAAVIVAVGRWQWGRRVERLIDAQIAAWRAAGEPIGAEELDLPDEQNAAWFITEAMRRYKPPPDDDVMDIENYQGGKPPGAVVSGHLERNALPLRLLREARARPAAAWREDWLDLLLQWPGLLHMSHVPRTAALAALADNNEAAAVEYILDLLHMADALACRVDSRAIQSSWALRHYALGAAEPVLIRMSLGKRPASTDQLRRLAQGLADGRRTTDQSIRLLHAERLRVLTEQDVRHGALEEPSLLERAARAAVHPAVRMQQLRAACEIDRMIACLRRNDWPGASVLADVRTQMLRTRRHYLYAVQQTEQEVFGWQAAQLILYSNANRGVGDRVAAVADAVIKLNSARHWLGGLADAAERKLSATTRPSRD